MPEEFSRTTARKRIILPHGGTVDIPVITKISFIDAADRYQETQFTVDNSAQSGRQVHVDQVPSTTDPSALTLPVERIDKFTVIDAADRGQETQVTLDNVTGADSVPPHFSAHKRTHVKRYQNETNPNIWIESELIDELAAIDAADRYQESQMTLNNTDLPANPDDPDISDSGNGIDPPWRTDPFQNIIDWSDRAPETGEDIARCGFWVTSYVGWHYGSAAGGTYVSNAVTWIEIGKTTQDNPDALIPPRRWGLFYNGLPPYGPPDNAHPAFNGPQPGNPGNATDNPTPNPTTIIQSFSGTSFTQSNVTFDNGDSFDGAGTFDFSAITADYFVPNTGEMNSDPMLAGGYEFPFPGPPRDIHFTCELVTDNGNYPGPVIGPPRAIPAVFFIESTAT